MSKKNRRVLDDGPGMATGIIEPKEELLRREKDDVISIGPDGVVRKSELHTSPDGVTSIVKQPAGPTVWKNKEIKPFSKLTIHIPLKIVSVMKALSIEYSDVEFSILCNTTKGEESGHVYLSEDFYVPKQEVTSAHIDYLEDHINYNTVIHKHPNGLRTFSTTDSEYINSNFDFSLLWTSGEFVKAVTRIRTEYGYISVDTAIAIDYAMVFDLTDEMKDKIIKKSWSAHAGSAYSQYYGGRYGVGNSGLYGSGSTYGYNSGYRSGYSGSVSPDKKDEDKSVVAQYHMTDEEYDEWLPYWKKLQDADNTEVSIFEELDPVQTSAKDAALKSDGTIEDFDPSKKAHASTDNIDLPLISVEDEIVFAGDIDEAMEFATDEDIITECLWRGFRVIDEDGNEWSIPENGPEEEIDDEIIDDETRKNLIALQLE